MTQSDSDLTQPLADRPPAAQQQSADNILVVDDTASNRQLLTDLLTGQGYDVRVAPDGPTALMLAQAEPPDLLLLDIAMPGMDGYDVCRQLKSQATTVRIPIIFISALGDVVDKVKGFELGGADYITKPFQAEEVLARVKTHLSLYKLQKELEQRNEALQQEITERIQAQEAASYERDLMQILLRNTTDYVYFKDRDRRFVRASNAFCNLFKRNLEEIIGKRDEELFPPEIAQETANDDRHVIETGTPLINREEGGLIGGEEHWVLTTKLPWYGKDGNIAGLFGISREITERKLMEEALQASEARLRAQYESIPIPTYTWQRRGDDLVLVDYNTAAFTITQGKIADLVGRKAGDMYQGRPDIQDDLARCLAEQSSFERELVYEFRSTGETKHLGVKCAFVPPDLVLVHTEDITERKQAEADLHFQAQLLEVVGQAVIATDLDERVIYWNPYAEKLYGWPAAEAMDRMILELIPAEGTAEYGAEIMARLQAGESWSGEFPVRRRDGTAFIAHVTDTPIRDEEGNLIGIIGISWDITERKQAEEALQASQQFAQSTLDALVTHIAILDETGTILAVNASWRRFGEENGLVWKDFGVGRNYLEVVQAASPESVEGAFEAATGLQEVISEQRDSFWLEYACHSPGEERWFVMRVTRFASSQGLRIVVSHNDITHRVQAENTVRRRVEEISTLHTITQTMAAATDLPATLKVVVEMITYLFDAEITFVAVPAVEDIQLQILAGFRQKTTSFSETLLAFPLTEMPDIHQVLNHGQTLVQFNIQSRTMSSHIRTYVEELDLQTVMLIPLKVGGNVMGILGVGAQQSGRTFGTDEVALVETIAGEIAAAVKNAQLAMQAQVAAVDAERQRLARELHDSVTQSLYSLTLLASGWGTLASQGRLNQQEVVDSFKQLGEIGQQGLKEMRLLIHQLRPPVLEEVGLIGALQQRLDAVEQRVNVETHLYTQGTDELSPDVAEQLYGIALEALNNTLRHARATVVTINLQEKDNCLRLAIQDNGGGFDSAAPSLGLGLTTMQERAQAINANLHITSAPQQGTTVEVTLALESNDND